MSETKHAPVTQQPGQNEAPSYRVVTGTEEWNNEIFGCFDDGISANDQLCLKATFCPCFVYGKQQARLRDPSLQNYERINNDTILFAGATYLCGLSWVLNFLKRGELREKYNIKGSQISDCLYSACCGCCVLIQQEKEIIGRQNSSVTQQGYVRPENMTA